jgi:lipoyl(octanoyl) transferase
LKQIKKLQRLSLLNNKQGEQCTRSSIDAGETGVWLDANSKGKERKICAMGIRCSRGVTMHGFALNVNVDLNYFNFITPCRIQNKQVTSIQRELGRFVPMEEVKEKLVRNFENVFEAKTIDAIYLQS